MQHKQQVDELNKAMVKGDNLERAAKRIFGPPVDTVDASKSVKDGGVVQSGGRIEPRPRCELRRERRQGWNE